MSAGRLRHPDGTAVHLAYGTNVHPAESLDGVLAQLDRYAEPVRRELGWDRLGLGLWLAADVAAELATDPVACRHVRSELDARGLEVVTLNAFPYRGFHDAVVKHAVYQPSWTDPARAKYTLDCARVLCELLPDDADQGSISTLPLGWREPWTPCDDDAALVAVDATTRELRRLARPISLAFEPEPGCVLDTVADAVRWLGGRIDPEYVGICLDTCHLAVSFADPAAAVDSVWAGGLAIPKVQASAALQTGDPRADLPAFAEPRYLHQVRTASGGRADDLPEALAELPAQETWRVHFHVPLHGHYQAPDPGAAGPAQPGAAGAGGGLTATTDVLAEALRALYGRPRCGSPHVEVETYTWGVLPQQARPADDAGLVAGIAAELRYAHELLVHSGLTPDGPAPDGLAPDRSALDGQAAGGSAPSASELLAAGRDT